MGLRLTVTTDLGPKHTITEASVMAFIASGVLNTWTELWPDTEIVITKDTTSVKTNDINQVAAWLLSAIRADRVR